MVYICAVRTTLKNIKKKKTMQQNDSYLFFDTETTGIPRNYKAPVSDSNNWPRLVQIGWILTDSEGCETKSCNYIIYPEGFTIPADAAKLHGISTEKALAEGVLLLGVLEEFLDDMTKVQNIVGHNLEFDKNIVAAELYRNAMPYHFNQWKSFCTMHSSTNFCAIRGSYGFKWPRLEELYKKLFGCMFDGAHNAFADITATKKCFFEMKKRGII